jgi:hypothetical protein
MQLSMSASTMLARGAQDGACSIDNFMEIYGFISTKFSDYIRFKLVTNRTE